MKMMKKTILMAIAFPLALGSMSAFAGGDHQGHGMGSSHGKNKIFSQLDLTATQKEQMKDLRKANRSEMKAERAAQRSTMQADHMEIQKLVLADNFDEQAVRNLVEKMTQQQVEHRVEALKMRHQMLNILTPEQKTKYSELMQQQMEKRANKQK